MCGICGYFCTKGHLDELEKMTSSLKHRGPDDGDIVRLKTDFGFCGLGHRRLAILDLSKEGHQPMSIEDNDYTIVFNGEIYNFKELKEEILSIDSTVKFRSTSDTEVLLYGYKLWREEVLSHLNGMFSFAIWDNIRQVLFIARDRMGQKPLYYYSKNGLFVFASEIKSLKCIKGISLNLDDSVVFSYFCRGYISAPSTIYKEIKVLEPASYMILNYDGLVIEKYWTIDSNNKFDLSQIELENKFEELLIDSVSKRLIADVKVGTFLSGGIDSSLITSIAGSIVGNHNLDTFTIKFKNRFFDESEYARKISKFLGTRHHEFEVDSLVFDSLVEILPEVYDEPFADTSAVATLLVSMIARKNVTVALSGDAGDELFGGYGTHKKLDILQKNFSLLKCLHLPYKVFENTGLVPVQIKKAFDLFENQEDLVEFRDFETENIISKMITFQSCELKIDTSEISESDLIERKMHYDAITYLPNDILVKVDRASMRYSLETRSPLLDYRIVEMAFKMPQSEKYANGYQKRILKSVLYKYIPDELFHHKKMGFGVPVLDFLRSKQNRERLVLYSDEIFLKNQGIFDVKVVKMMIDKYLNGSDFDFRYSQILWRYFVFQLWYEKNMI